MLMLKVGVISTIFYCLIETWWKQADENDIILD
jgi:hypothetical protein